MYYFAKAKVSYPPREVTFIALKQEKKLELWARDNGEFRFIRDYFIMAASGEAGPKLRQGDRQVPEGIYRIASVESEQPLSFVDENKLPQRVRPLTRLAGGTHRSGVGYFHPRQNRLHRLLGYGR